MIDIDVALIVPLILLTALVLLAAMSNLWEGFVGMGATLLSIGILLVAVSVRLWSLGVG